MFARYLHILGSKSKSKTALATWYDLNLPHFVESPLLALESCQRSNPFQQLLTTWRRMSASSPLAHLSNDDREFCSCTHSHPFQQLLTTWRQMSASSPLLISAMTTVSFVAVPMDGVGLFHAPQLPRMTTLGLPCYVATCEQTKQNNIYSGICLHRKSFASFSPMYQETS